MLYNGIPVFAVNVESEDCTITTISLVDEPAMELQMQMFDKKETVKFSLQDEVKHNIVSCIVRTDFPILRLTQEGNPYYIVFNRETSEILCQRLMRDGFQQNISLDHSGKLIDGIQLQEVFIKDSARGISPIGFEEAAEGSLFGVYHITDDALWKDCIEGKFGGVSLESYIDLQKFNKIDNKKTKNIMSKIKDALKRLLMEFNTLSTDKAELYWEEDTELMVGYKVFVEDESGNKVPAMDGEYISDENKIKVAGGVVTEIERREVDDVPVEVPAEKKEDVMEEPAMEEPAKEEPAKEEPATEEPKDDNTEKVAELEKKVADLETKLADLEAKLAEIATTPAAQPVIDEFENIKKRGTTGDKKLDKRIAIAQALKEN